MYIHTCEGHIHLVFFLEFIDFDEVVQHRPDLLLVSYEFVKKYHLRDVIVEGANLFGIETKVLSSHGMAVIHNIRDIWEKFKWNSPDVR